MARRSRLVSKLADINTFFVIRAIGGIGFIPLIFNASAGSRWVLGSKSCGDLSSKFADRRAASVASCEGEGCAHITLYPGGNSIWICTTESTYCRIWIKEEEEFWDFKECEKFTLGAVALLEFINHHYLETIAVEREKIGIAL